jgi:hypothetical protein
MRFEWRECGSNVSLYGRNCARRVQNVTVAGFRRRHHNDGEVVDDEVGRDRREARKSKQQDKVPKNKITTFFFNLSLFSVT